MTAMVYAELRRLQKTGGEYPVRISHRALAARIGLNWATVQSALRRLEVNGLIRKATPRCRGERGPLGREPSAWRLLPDCEQDAVAPSAIGRDLPVHLL